MNQPLPGAVCTRFDSKPSGASGPKYRSIEPAPTGGTASLTTTSSQSQSGLLSGDGGPEIAGVDEVGVVVIADVDLDDVDAAVELLLSPRSRR